MMEGVGWALTLIIVAAVFYWMGSTSDAKQQQPVTLLVSYAYQQGGSGLSLGHSFTNLSKYPATFDDWRYLVDMIQAQHGGELTSVVLLNVQKVPRLGTLEETEQ